LNATILCKVPESFVESDEFLNMSTGFKKIFFFSLWVKVILAKYISLWLLAEGTVILSGDTNPRPVS
jgi:hypothetical protein